MIAASSVVNVTGMERTTPHKERLRAAETEAAERPRPRQIRVPRARRAPAAACHQRQHHRRERAMGDDIGVAFMAAAMISIIMNAVAVPGQRRETEQLDMIGLPAGDLSSPSSPVSGWLSGGLASGSIAGFSR